MAIRILLAGLVAAVLASAPAAAATTLFAGTGVVTAVTGFRGTQPTGTVSIGDTLNFGTVFDPSVATRIFDGGRGQQVFALPEAVAGATAGDFVFTQSPVGSSVAILGRGFRIFPGMGVSQQVLNQQINFNGLPTGSPAFDVGTNGRIGLLFLSVFQEFGDTPTPTIGDLRDPREAVINRFTIAFSDGRSTIGIVEGDFFGGFAAAVPEPGTWALLILGFGVVGSGMRGARRARDPALA
jgi:hypothetical protein